MNGNNVECKQNAISIERIWIWHDSSLGPIYHSVSWSIPYCMGPVHGSFFTDNTIGRLSSMMWYA